MTRSSKHKRAKKASRKDDEAVEEKATDTPPEETVAKGDANNPQPDEEAAVVANEPPDEEKQQEEEEVAEEQNDEEKDESSSKKRRLEEDDGFMNWGKMVMEWTAPVVHTLGSFWNSIVGGGAPPAEPAEGPPAIDAVIPMMVVGDVRVLQTAWLDAVGPVVESSPSNGRTVEEYKKDFAFETRVGETKTIHSVRLQLYDCYGSPADDSVKDSSAALAAVQTIVLALSITQQAEEWKEALKKWTTWIRQQFPEPKIVLLWTLEDDSTEWPLEATVTEFCQTCGIESWHVLSSDSSLPRAVSSVDDFLHSLVRSQHWKPQGDDDEAKKPSPKRRKVTREKE